MASATNPTGKRGREAKFNLDVEAAVNAGAKVIDLPGTTLTPGLVEGHSHILLHAYSEASWTDQVSKEGLGLRVARASGQDMLAFSKPFLRDSSAAVRREIALMLQDRSRMLPAFLTSEPVPASPELIDAIATIASQYDGQDRWYLEAIGIAARGREDALYAKMKSGAPAQQSASFAGQVVRGSPWTSSTNRPTGMADRLQYPISSSQSR